MELNYSRLVIVTLSVGVSELVRPGIDILVLAVHKDFMVVEKKNPWIQ